MITKEDIIAAIVGPATSDARQLTEADAALADFVGVDGSRMYVSAAEELKARRSSLPPLHALERLRGAIDDSRRGQLAAEVLLSFRSKRIADVEAYVAGRAPKLRCKSTFAAELVADALIMVSEFAAAWNRSKLHAVKS